MEKVLGGHAIMLRCLVPQELANVAISWVREKPEVRKLKIWGDGTLWHSHLTLCFVGRDKPPEVGEKMLEAAKLLVDTPYLPKAIEPLLIERFGFKRDHLAVATRTYEQLLCCSDFISNYLVATGVKRKSDFPFNPHVTLASGEPNFHLETNILLSHLQLQVEGLEVKIGSDRTEFLPL